MRGHSTSTPRSAARAAVTGALALALAVGLSPMGPPLATPGPAAVTAPVQRAAVNVAALTPSQTLATLTLDQRVGQVLMMGVPATGASATDLSILTKNKIGNVFLKGRSYTGVTATKAVVNKINATVSLTSTGGQKRFIATDQEGGYVQVLKGPGFSTMPTALHQGTWAPSTLKAAATTWAKQLHAAGLNVNLAPVADTVPSAAFAPYNLPIGYWHREYGYTSWHVADEVAAFVSGMRAGGIAPVAKHFPGLGRVTKNTDTSTNVKDTITTRYSVYRRPFIRAMAYGTRWIMVSNAIYTQIDPSHVGPFSSTIMKTMLRHDLGFTGIVISDDMCNAKQLSPWSYATRAKNFFNAGGTMMLCVNAAAIPTIHQALVSAAKASPSFRAKIDAAALEVLQTRAGQ
ncbi:beta-N-acetylhexosaminidase [Paeniglutamicibacter psychrophenolicus]|uniref:beta-N-acetylhexosaminidase n=1 Tax=Paeniglutamicibacter psychrophenolicus TaxID=257454 RepID=A0ABS4WAD8_9MICC|nr:beta-N-acetylhexosaminidase [Paeniglutamicibacter psychrophenolicus]